MESSESTSAKKIGQRNTRDRPQRFELHRIQHTRLIWLDSSANDGTDNCRNTVAQLRRIVSDVSTFVDGEQCHQFIEKLSTGKICMVVSGSLWQYVVPCLHDLSQIDSIFIVSSNDNHYEEYVEYWPKIKGVFTEITLVCEALRRTAQQHERSATSMSFVATDTTVDRLDPSFMYTHILREILLTIDFNDQHIREYVDYCREAFQDDTAELKNIQHLDRHYHDETPIWWYTYECFFYRMLNRALRTLDSDIMVRLGFFINDLHRHIEREHLKQYVAADHSAPFTVFRGQGLSKNDFEQLAKIKGGLMSFNCFLSTSRDRLFSLAFAESAASNPDLVGILFEMTIDPSQSTTPFASTSHLSAIEGEDEVLFAMQSVFRVRDINMLDERSTLYKVYLSLTSDNDRQLGALTVRIREESYPDQGGWYRLASVLKSLGDLNRAREIYETLLHQQTSEDDRAYFYDQLAGIEFNGGDYQEAINYYNKALAIDLQSRPSTHPDLASSYSTIGLVYQSMGDYPKALESLEKALAIQQQSLPPTHPDLAKPFNNIALVYYSMGDYPRALALCEKALAIQQQSLPPTHPDLATTNNNIGGVYERLGDYAKALVWHEKALAVYQQLLPAIHPCLGESYNNIGMVHQSLGDYPKALELHERAMAIRQQSLPSTHPCLGDSYNNIGMLYYNMGDYSKALKLHEKAMAIRQKSLSPVHPDVATSYNNIGSVYKSLGNYPKALEFNEKALAIQQQLLPPTHPDVATSYNNIGSVYQSMGDYPKSLELLEKALAIQQQSLPLTHPSSAMCYKNIGSVHENMGNYSQAHFFFEGAVKIVEQGLPPSHPFLEEYKGLLARMEKKLLCERSNNFFK